MKGLVIIFVLISVFVYSAMDLVTIRYKQRLLYTEIARVQEVSQRLGQEWDDLQFVRASLTSALHIDNVMRQKLKMQPADINQIIYIKESELSNLNMPEMIKE